MKRKILIASHGRLASGLQSSIDILTGQGQQIKVIDAYLDDSDYTPVIEDFIADVAADEQGLIFTDLLGGSVNQKTLNLLMNQPDKPIFLISNSNLATVLSLLYLKPQEALTEADIEQALQESQVQLVKTSLETDDEEDFFA